MQMHRITEEASPYLAMTATAMNQSWLETGENT